MKLNGKTIGLCINIPPRERWASGVDFSLALQDFSSYFAGLLFKSGGKLVMNRHAGLSPICKRQADRLTSGEVLEFSLSPADEKIDLLVMVGCSFSPDEIEQIRKAKHRGIPVQLVGACVAEVSAVWRDCGDERFFLVPDPSAEVGNLLIALGKRLAQ